jgi:hypothetical protein
MIAAITTVLIAGVCIASVLPIFLPRRRNRYRIGQIVTYRRVNHCDIIIGIERTFFTTRYTVKSTGGYVTSKDLN